MKGNEEVIKVLNEVLTSELTAINQYFIHSKMCEDWGFNLLAAKKQFHAQVRASQFYLRLKTDKAGHGGIAGSLHQISDLVTYPNRKGV